MSHPFEVQGHRGARGLLPENTIPSLIRAVELGAHVVEFDVVVSKDHKVVLSHEPWFSAKICSDPEGKPVPPSKERSYNLYKLTYEEIAQFDCGIRGNPAFPHQQPMAVSKPRMTDAIEEVEKFVREEDLLPVKYNVEVKCHPKGDRTWHPEAAVFARLVYDELKAVGVLNRSIVQSFDVRILQAVRAIDPEVTLALLVQNVLGLRVNLKALGFVPEIYSPQYRLLTAAMIRAAHDKGMRVIPWTVNDPERMLRLQRMGVDGIITDYPDRAAFLIEEFRLREP